MRRDRLYRDDVVEAADAIGGFLVGVTEEFLASDSLQSAVLQKLTIIG